MFKKKIDSMDTVTEFSSLREIQLTIESLYDSQPVRNEITPGYYRIVSAGKGQYDNKTFDYEYKFAWFNKNNTVCWKKYDPYDVGMIYKLINQGNGWILLNLRDSTYVVNGKINNEVSASDTFEVQNFTLLQDGKYIIQASTSNQCYSLCKNFCGPSENQGRLMTFGTLEDNEDKAFNVWFLEPVQNEFVTYLSNEFSKQNIQYVLKKYGKLPSNIKEGIDPGFSKKNSIDTYKNALAKLRSWDEDSSDSIKYIAIATLKNAYEQACTINPIKAGFYNVVTAGNGTGYSGGPYNYENKSAIYNQGKFVKWGPFSQSNYGSIYLFSKADNYSWHLYSVVDHSYINKGSKSYSTQISTSVDKETSQTFKYIKDGKFSFNFSGNPYVYSVAPSHNGSTNENGTLNIWGTPEEAEKYGVNLWYIKSVPDSVISEFYKTAEGLLAKCLYYEDLANDLKIGQNPGYYIEQNVLALKSFLSETKEKLKKDVSDTERILIKEEMDKLYNNALKTNPIYEGYYYIVNNNKAYVRTYKNNVSLYTVPYYFVYNNSVACMYNTLDKTNANYVYKISLNNDSTYTIQNAYTSMFLAPELNDSETTGVLCCSNNVRSCNFVFNSVGEFYITDTKKSLNICLPDSIEKYGFVLNNRKLDNCFISNNYTWSLVPVNKEDVDKIISRQKAIDEEKDVAFVEMVSFVDSINMTYSKIINETTKYDIEALAILKSKMSVVKKYIASHSFDITSTANDYLISTERLKTAFEDALKSKADTINTPLTGRPIGAISVDYSNNQPSTVVNSPKDAFDNDFSTIYASYERSTGYVGLDLGKKYVIKKVAYAPRNNWANRMVLGVFEGANKADFSDAIPIYIIKEEPEYNKMTSKKISCTRGFRYVRYVGPDDARCNVAELCFYGTEGEGNDSHLYQLTNLPLVVIRTDENVSEVTSRTKWMPGHVNIIYDNGKSLKTDSLTVRGRGNGSWSFDKKPYKLKFLNKTKLLGMPAKAKEWTLINNYGDKSLIRNNIAFSISKIFEMDYTPACTLVDVIFNGQYKGNYQLCDQIEVRKNRVDITEMTREDNHGENLTGGYLIEIDAYAESEPKKFTSNLYGIPVTVHYPKSDEITTEQFEYIKRYFNNLCTSVYSDLYKSETSGYKKYIDENSWLKYFLIEELTGNTDAYWSVYLAKERNQVFKVYPVWDFDLAFDNDKRTHPILTMSDFLSFSTKSSAATGARNFNRKIIEGCSDELKELWSWYRYRGNLTYEHLSAIVDSLYEENSISQEYNYLRWPILNVCTQQQYIARGSYKAEVDFINEYLYDRIAWLDNKVGLEEPIGIHDKTDFKINDRLCVGRDRIILRGLNINTQIFIYSLDGRLYGKYKVADFETVIPLLKGVYLVKAVDELEGQSSVKVVVK